MSRTPMSNMADAWVPLMREALFNQVSPPSCMMFLPLLTYIQLNFNKRYACPEANCSMIYGPKVSNVSQTIILIDANWCSPHISKTAWYLPRSGEPTPAFGKRIHSSMPEHSVCPLYSQKPASRRTKWSMTWRLVYIMSPSF